MFCVLNRAAIQVQFVRENRRSCYRRPWHVIRKGSPHYQMELTPESSEFLRSTVVDHYEGKLKESPLKDGPWKQEPWTLKFVVPHQIF